MGNLLIQNRALAYHLRRFVPSDCPDCCGGKPGACRSRFEPGQTTVRIFGSAVVRSFSPCNGSCNILSEVNAVYDKTASPNVGVCRTFSMPVSIGTGSQQLWNACTGSTNGPSPTNTNATFDRRCESPDGSQETIAVSIISGQARIDATVNFTTGLVSITPGGVGGVLESSYSVQCGASGGSLTFTATATRRNFGTAGDCAGQVTTFRQGTVTIEINGMVQSPLCNGDGSNSDCGSLRAGMGSDDQIILAPLDDGGCLGCPQDGGLTA